MQGGAPPEQIAAGANAQASWDPSIKALTAFPQVLDQLAQNLQWTTDLGNAYYNQPQDVMQTIQVMRDRAQAAGNLQNTPQQEVIQDQGNIEIAPPTPQVVYVPQYNPWAVYGQPLAPYPGFNFFGAIGLPSTEPSSFWSRHRVWTPLPIPSAGSDGVSTGSPTPSSSAATSGAPTATKCTTGDLPTAARRYWGAHGELAGYRAHGGWGGHGGYSGGMQHTFRSGLDRGNFPNAIHPSPHGFSTAEITPAAIRAILETATASGSVRALPCPARTATTLRVAAMDTASPTAAMGSVPALQARPERRQFRSRQHLRPSQRLWKRSRQSWTTSYRATATIRRNPAVRPGPFRNLRRSASLRRWPAALWRRNEQPPILRLLVGQLHSPITELRHATRLRWQQHPDLPPAIFTQL